MSKPKRAGHKPLPGLGIRPVDTWRDSAAVPLPSLKVSSDLNLTGRPRDGGIVYALEEDGVVIGTWRHSDAPWLHAWLVRRLRQLHGAWHVARDSRPLTKGQQLTGAARATQLKAEAAALDARVLKAAQQAIATHGQMSNPALAEFLEDRGGLGTKSTLLKKLPKLLKPTK